MTERLACPPAPGLLEEYAVGFDEVFANVAQRRGFREYLQGLLLPRDRNKTITALVGAEPVVAADSAPVQKLQCFLSESTWDPETVNDRRLERLLSDPQTMSHARGVLVIDETGDRKDGTKTAHVGRQYLGSLGKVDNGIVAVSSLWADERVYYPLHVAPYTPAERLPQGKKDPAFRTKPQLAVELVAKAVGVGVAFRAVVADCLYGESRAFEGELWQTGLPYVVALKPSKGTWAREGEPHTPEEAARRLRWGGPDDPGDWTPVVRRFRDGHAETWWAADLSFGGYGPERSVRLVVATTDPTTLPSLSTWYLATNLSRPGSSPAGESEFAPADLAEVVRLYGLRNWVEQAYKQVKGELGWADFMVRADVAIRRHWELVLCAFSFCWHAWFTKEQVSDLPPEQAESTGASGPGPDVPSAVITSSEAEAAEPWRWGKNAGHAREAGDRAAGVDHLADGGAARPRVADPLGLALALVAGVVRLAPAARTTGASQFGWQRPPTQSLSPCLTKYR
jgi:DDE superfamily endonuclease